MARFDEGEIRLMKRTENGPLSSSELYCGCLARVFAADCFTLTLGSALWWAETVLYGNHVDVCLLFLQCSFFCASS